MSQGIHKVSDPLPDRIGAFLPFDIVRARTGSLVGPPSWCWCFRIGVCPHALKDTASGNVLAVIDLVLAKWPHLQIQINDRPGGRFLGTFLGLLWKD
jgi:hypothetical protein